MIDDDDGGDDLKCLNLYAPESRGRVGTCMEVAYLEEVPQEVGSSGE